MLNPIAVSPVASTTPVQPGRPTGRDASGAAPPAGHPFARMLRQNQAPSADASRQASAQADANRAAAAAADAEAEAAQPPIDSTQVGSADGVARTRGMRSGDKPDKPDKAGRSVVDAAFEGAPVKDEAIGAADEAGAHSADSATAAPLADPSLMQGLGGHALRADPRMAGEAANAADGKADPKAQSAAAPDPNGSSGKARGLEQAEAAPADRAIRKAEDPEPASKTTFAEALALHAPMDAPGLAVASEAVRSAPGAESSAHRIDAAATPVTGSATFTPAVSTLPPAAAPLGIDFTTPLGAPDFAHALGAQMSVLARDGVQRAELHLHPADMGPVSVQITLDGAHARIDFGADLAATRHVIENGLPELASALRDAGLTLTGGGVSSHARGRGESQGGAGQPNQGPRRGGIEAEAVAAPRPRTVALGGVDLYA